VKLTKYIDAVGGGGGLAVLLLMIVPIRLYEE
jgi:hypothetical protein